MIGTTQAIRGLSVVACEVEAIECEGLRGAHELTAALHLTLMDALQSKGFDMADGRAVDSIPVVRFSPWLSAVTGVDTNSQPCNVGLFAAWELAVFQRCVLLDDPLSPPTHALTWRTCGCFVIGDGEDILDMLSTPIVDAVEQLAEAVKTA